MKRVTDVNGISFFLCFGIFTHATFQRYTFYPWIYGLIFVQVFDFFRSRSFCHSDTLSYTFQPIAKKKYTMFYLSIQLLCIKTYDYFLFDIPTFRYSITWQKQGANAFWFIDLYSIFYGFNTINTYFILIERILLLAFVFSTPTPTHIHSTYVIRI